MRADPSYDYSQICQGIVRVISGRNVVRSVRRLTRILVLIPCQYDPIERGDWTVQWWQSLRSGQTIIFGLCLFVISRHNGVSTTTNGNLQMMIFCCVNTIIIIMNHHEINLTNILTRRSSKRRRLHFSKLFARNGKVSLPGIV